MLRIGAFSKLAHTSIKTLRFYEAQGLLRPVHVDGPSGYRYYTADQIGDLRLILRLKGLGFSLAEIRDALKRRPDTIGLHNSLLEKREALVRQARETQSRIAGIDRWTQQIREGGSGSPYAITLKQIGPHAIASIRVSIDQYADAADLFQELHYSLKRRNDPGDPRAAIWHTCGDSRGPIDCEVFAVARRPPIGGGRLRVQERPTTLVACVVHQGELGSSPSPYVAARLWIASHGYRIIGSKRELYWQGDLDANRSSDVTEIQFPIEAIPGKASRGEAPVEQPRWSLPSSSDA
jgi:DNA-binding transcriptional MerR regulator